MQDRYYKQNTSTHKKCKSCGAIKERSEYYKDSRRKDGITAYCKPCKLEINQAWRESNPDKYQKSVVDLKWTAKSRRYGISKEEFFTMLEQQNNSCAICKESIGESAHVDHCHSSGKVRGLLCASCNKGLGMFKDNIAHLESAIEYLNIQ
jgi:hypothetical protein